MTTLVVTSSWPRTLDEAAGTFVRADALARARASRGARIVILAPSGPGSARGGDGLEIVDAPHGGLFGSPGAAARAMEHPLRLAGLAPWAHAIARAIDTHRPARIVAHWLAPAGLVACALAPSGAALELVAHGGDVRLLEALPRALARRCIDTLCDRAEVVRVVAPGVLARLEAISKRVRTKAVVAPMPLTLDDPETLAETRARGASLRAELAQLEPQARGLLHVVASRLVPSKPLDRALEHVARRRAPLVLVGDGPERGRLVERARRLGVDLRAPGALPHEETLGWIAAADVLLAPLARGEGAPTAIREARALGVPVIAFA